jgi:ubiquinone/menaquinone biosynthesis C-methylase UbiE
MQEQKDIIDCDDRTASNYAEKFINELEHKHLDKILLKAFALENIGKGKLIDLGCGPGQTTKFLFDCGFGDIIGVDISSEMVTVARNINPHLNFEKADILNLNYPDNSFGSAIAFYSIVHFDYEQVKTAFKEIKRVLVIDGQFLFTFHVGNNIVHLDNFLDHDVNIDFYFFETSKIKDLLITAGFEIVDIIERQPYKDIEYQSERAYIWTKSTLPPLTK